MLELDLAGCFISPYVHPAECFHSVVSYPAHLMLRSLSKSCYSRLSTNMCVSRWDVQEHKLVMATCFSVTATGWDMYVYILCLVLLASTLTVGCETNFLDGFQFLEASCGPQFPGPIRHHLRDVPSATVERVMRGFLK